MTDTVAEVIFLPVPTDSVQLFTVWFDVNCGTGEPNWWWDGRDKPFEFPLSQALEHITKLRAKNWICKMVFAGENPRPDGRWDNPAEEG